MLRTSRIVSLILALVVVLSTACTSPSTAKPAPEPTTIVSGGTLTRAMTTEPDSLDPQGPANSGLSLLLPYVFDTLITQQSDGKYAGILAESWKVSPDGKTVDIKLKSGVKFHDGSPLNSEAVVFTFNRFATDGTKSPIAANIKAITKVEAIDELNVRIRMDKPSATILNTLSMPYASILSPTAVKAAGAEMGTKPVGTGPFKLESWQQGVSVVFARNPDYKWGTPDAKNPGPVFIDKLVFKVIPDASTQLSALRAGDVDVIFTTDPGQLAALQNDKNFQVNPVKLDALIYLGYNCAQAPFNEVKVRQALSYAVNKTEIIKTALGGLGVEAVSPLVPTMLGYSADQKSYGQSYDPAKAKALLAEAGFTQSADGAWQRDGKKLAGKLLTSSRAPNDSVATVLQSQFKAIGVPVEIQMLDSSAVMQATTQGAFDLLLWRYDWSDPDILNTYLTTSRIRQTNRVFYSNTQVDSLLERGGTELDQVKRAQIYQDAVKQILTDAPWQPLYIPAEAMVSRNRVKGIISGAMARMIVNDVTLSEK